MAVIRLMRLDAALMTPDAASYAALTEQDLRGGWRAIEPPAGPSDGTSAAPASRPRRLPLIHPVGIDSGGRTVFVCLITEAKPDRFRRALQGLLAHLATVHAWSLFVVFTARLARLTRAYQTMACEELESPLTDDDVQGLWRLFLRRREGVAEGRELPPLPGVAGAGYQLFTRPRFNALYRRWMEVRDTAFEPLRSTAAVDAIAERRGHVEYLTLARDYEHLVPLADGQCETRRRAAPAGSAFDDGLDSAECLVGGQLEFREFSRGQRPSLRVGGRPRGGGARLRGVPPNRESPKQPVLPSTDGLPAIHHDRARQTRGQAVHPWAAHHSLRRPGVSGVRDVRRRHRFGFPGSHT
jgi:hypothetical protein